MRVYERARRESATGSTEALATRVQPFLPEAGRDALAQTIARYQQMGTWSGETRISEALFSQTVDVFTEAGYIAARPRMEDVCQACPSG
jgi:hypothetical protein